MLMSHKQKAGQNHNIKTADDDDDDHHQSINHRGYVQ
jgi:hypothetical protein